MIFDRNANKPVIALLGAGSMGTAIVRRIAAGKKILLGDTASKRSATAMTTAAPSSIRRRSTAPACPALGTRS